ncbi:MAG TPA: F0F1 ATP synthase subunit B [Burkholderiales bacterium]|nr:F0F1 ATP synthase subunit B [Burkholderiales bacterium]
MNINLTLFAQAITFAAFIWFTAKFVWPPLMRAIQTRQQQIADGLAAGEKGRQELELSGKRASAELAKARERAQEIVALAEKRAAQMVEEAKGLAREEGNREKGAAKAEIEQEVARARETLREQVVALVVAGAEKILRREVNAQAHSDLLNQLKREI